MRQKNFTASQNLNKVIPLSLTLRDDQVKVISEIQQHIESRENRILIFMPTGAGKTFTVAQLIKMYSNQKHLFIVNRDPLVLQALEEFALAGIESGVWAGEYKSFHNEKLNVQIASAQTINARGMDWFNPDFIHLDEAHLTAYCAIAQGYFNSKNIVTGWTATPERLATDEELGDKFNVLVKGLMPWEMISMGLLKKPIYYSLEQKIDYKIRHPNTITVAINEYKRLARNRQTLCFAADVEQAHQVAAEFTAAGLPFAAIDGTMSPSYRQSQYQLLREGKIVGLSSYDALSEGFNIKSISCIILMRKTDSRSKYFQQKGRGLRQFPGINDCIFLDLVGLCSDERFGTIEDILDVGLETSFEKEPGTFPKKVCPNCNAVVAASDRQCPHCNYKFPLKDMPPLSLEEKLCQQIPINERQLWRSCRAQRKKAYQQGLLTEENNFAPELLKNAIFGEKASIKDESNFLKFLQTKAINEGKDQNWVKTEFAKEFGNIK